jgi:non-specific protein-tyrosine kinase
MELRRYWYVLTKWIWLIALATVVAAAVSFVVSRSMKPVYSASATILVNQAQNPTTPDYNSVLASERLTQTYSQLIRTRPILEQVIKDQNLQLTPDQLDRLVNVQVVPNTQLITISIEDNSPARARDVSNALANDFIAQFQKDTLGLTANSQQVLQGQISALEDQMKNETTHLEQLRANNQAQSPEALQLEGLISQQQITYSQLLRNQQAMQLSATTSVDSVRIVEPAALPDVPVRPRVSLYVLLAAVLGLVLGVCAAFLIEYLDDSVKTPDDIESVTGLSSLGTIMRMASGSSEGSNLVDSGSSRSAIAEAYRVLRTNVDFARVGVAGNVFLITSSNQGEGKTTTSSNLAVMIAESGRQVIAIDSDLRRPSLHKMFGVPNAQGLTNLLLQGDPKIESALQPTRFPNLRVLTSGPIPPNPSELLASDKMRLVLDRIRGMADLVILDSPPILAVTDPTVLSTRVDGVILVVDAGKTRGEALARSKETITRGGARVLGVVLNRVTSRSGGYYYYYHYYYNTGDSNGTAGGTNGANGTGGGQHRRRSNGHQRSEPRGGLLETVRQAVLRQ